MDLLSRSVGVTLPGTHSGGWPCASVRPQCTAALRRRRPSQSPHAAASPGCRTAGPVHCRTTPRQRDSLGSHGLPASRRDPMPARWFKPSRRLPASKAAKSASRARPSCTTRPPTKRCAGLLRFLPSTSTRTRRNQPRARYLVVRQHMMKVDSEPQGLGRQNP